MLKIDLFAFKYTAVQMDFKWKHLIPAFG